MDVPARPRGLAVLAALALALPAAAQDPPQTQADDFTRYELQAPGSGAFRIVYDVSATTPGARFYYNSIRTGAEEEVHGVTDLHTGEALDWEVVDGSHARSHGHPRADPQGRYIKVALGRPVPEGGQGRVRIDKTYRDPESYYRDGRDVVFRRSLGIRRNAVVLPPGFELVAANYPVQVDTEEDGRIRVSFMSPGPGPVDFSVRARPWPGGARPAPSPPPRADVANSGGGSPAAARVGWTFPQRAFQDRDITYDLQDPVSHAFRLFHDYTESRPGTDRYLNVVRAGSAASDPEAYNLDTGEQLVVEQLKGAQITARGLDIGRVPEPDTEVVVIWFDPVATGASTRLRIWETYTDPGRYTLAGEELVWDRALGRSRNTVVLPSGWSLTANSIPGVVSETADGRIQIRYINPRPDQIQVFIRARRR
ncbi:MAG: hypothetical protein JSU98_06330 [Gemmatimonadales bacterium]|nr:MAG: hypothetical protein JSU98_06330 [Gemmatimonadales bacterium]